MIAWNIINPNSSNNVSQRSGSIFDTTIPQIDGGSDNINNVNISFPDGGGGGGGVASSNIRNRLLVGETSALLSSSRTAATPEDADIDDSSSLLVERRTTSREDDMFTMDNNSIMDILSQAIQISAYDESYDDDDDCSSS